MTTASALRLQIESTLAQRIPSALTPAPKMIRPVATTGIEPLDDMLGGGLPIGAISELVGPDCSGRTSAAISFLARTTQAAKVCVWIDVSNAFDPASAAASGVDLARLLWVRCGVPASANASHTTRNGFTLPEQYLAALPVKKGLHGGGFGPHPRNEVKGLSEAVDGFLRSEVTSPRCGEPQLRMMKEEAVFEPKPSSQPIRPRKRITSGKPWARIEQALRVTDLLLQAGGFSAIVLDMGSIAPEYASRVPLATWFRYRAAAERTQSSILLLTQHACAKSSAGLVLRLQPGDTLREEKTVFTGVEYRVEVARQRFQTVSSNIVPLRKPPQRATDASWQSHTPWAGRR
jgi:recombination protein RecA